MMKGHLVKWHLIERHFLSWSLPLKTTWHNLYFHYERTFSQETFHWVTFCELTFGINNITPQALLSWQSIALWDCISLGGNYMVTFCRVTIYHMTFWHVTYCRMIFRRVTLRCVTLHCGRCAFTTSWLTFLTTQCYDEWLFVAWHFVDFPAL